MALQDSSSAAPTGSTTTGGGTPSGIKDTDKGTGQKRGSAGQDTDKGTGKGNKKGTTDKSADEVLAMEALKLKAKN